MLKVLEHALASWRSANPYVAESAADERTKNPLAQALVCTVAGLGLLLLGFLLDGQVARILTLRSSNIWRSLAIYSSKAGEGWVIAVVGATISLLLLLLRRFRASRAVFLVALTGLLTGFAATIMRSLLGRTRPDSHEIQGFYGVWHHAHWIFGKYEFGAFPSGHAATVIGLATAAWLIDRRFGVLAAGYAALVCWSRIALGCHHFSDTIAAGILGIYGARLVLRRWGYFGEAKVNCRPQSISAGPDPH